MRRGETWPWNSAARRVMQFTIGSSLGSMADEDVRISSMSPSVATSERLKRGLLRER